MVHRRHEFEVELVAVREWLVGEGFDCSDLHEFITSTPVTVKEREGSSLFDYFLVQPFSRRLGSPILCPVVSGTPIAGDDDSVRSGGGPVRVRVRSNGLLDLLVATHPYGNHVREEFVLADPECLPKLAARIRRWLCD
jgi:hypothetical protein